MRSLTYRTEHGAPVSSGKATCHYHKAREDDEDRNVPAVGVGYAFLTESVEDNPCRDELTIVVGKDGKRKCVVPIPVPQKWCRRQCVFRATHLSFHPFAWLP